MLSALFAIANSLEIDADVLNIKDGQVLMTKRSSKFGHGSYGAVGGHVEQGEHPMDTVEREAREDRCRIP